MYAASSGRCEGLLVTVTAWWRRPEWRRAAVATTFPHLDSGLWSAHPTYLDIYPVSTLYLLNIYSCFIFRGCWDVIVTLALLCGVPLGGGNLRCALTVDCTPILEHPPKLEIENNVQENILNG